MAADSSVLVQHRFPVKRKNRKHHPHAPHVQAAARTWYKPLARQSLHCRQDLPRDPRFGRTLEDLTASLKRPAVRILDVITATNYPRRKTASVPYKEETPPGVGKEGKAVPCPTRPRLHPISLPISRPLESSSNFNTRPRSARTPLRGRATPQHNTLLLVFSSSIWILCEPKLCAMLANTLLIPLPEPAILRSRTS
jgi:hypothetical protein